MGLETVDHGGQDTVGAAPLPVGALLAMLCQANDAVGVLEPDGRLRAMPFPLLGYPPEEVAGRFPLEFIHPDDVDRAAEVLLDTMATPGAVTAAFDCRLRTASGEWRHYEVVGTNLVHDPGVGGLVFTGRDVTAERHTQEALRRADRRWRNLLQSSTEEVTLLDATGNVIVDSGAWHMLGHDGPGLPDVRAVETVIHPDDLASSNAWWDRVVSTPGRSEPLVVRLRHRDGTWRSTESFTTNLLDDPDVRGIVITTRDVTEREKALRALREETRLLDTLQRVGQRLAGELDLDSLLQTVTDAATDVTDAAFGAFFYNAVGPDGASYLLYTLSGAPREAFASFPMPRATAVFAPTFDGVGPMRIDDVRTDLRYGQNAPYHGMPPGHLDVRSYLAVPVVSRSGEVHGGLFFGHPEPGVFSERGERLAVGIAAHAAIAIDNARLYQAAQREIAARRQAEAELAHQATHDPLTGLPNRVLLHDRLGQAVAHRDRQGRAVAVLLLDIDRFKVVNDSLGHAAGDEILVAIAGRLLRAVRPGDTVARLGGDEFVIVCEGVHGELDAVGLADRAAAAFATPFTVGDHELELTASVGIAMAAEEEADPDDLLRDADAVMYRAKARGGGRWEIFDTALRGRVVERLRVETDLRRGLAAHELTPYFQPIVSLETGAVVGAEALARWEHPSRGLVLPAEFVDVAEESGLVIQLGQRVLFDGCRKIAAWTKSGTALGVAVNVSTRQLVHHDLVSAVQVALEVTGADPTLLTLEITETALMEDVGAVSHVLRRLRALGLHLVVDDFGTGYSSLIYLRRLPIDGLKIDRSFVAGLPHQAEDAAIVASIVNLAHNLGLVALAEGVETQEQAEHLRALGCDQAQGFLWSPAVRDL
jgi:diguanylate cyclase (GGDEF)-like protein/PAS domain S-box-containing protein